MKSKLIVCLASMLLSVSAFAQLRPLLDSEAIRLGATHVWTVPATSLTDAVDDTAETVDLQLSDGTAVEFVNLALSSGFASGGTNDSVTIQVGDEDTAARFLAATQVAGSTPVLWAWPSLALLGPDTGTTNTAAVAARAVYTADKKLRLTFTPANSTAMEDYSIGEVKTYWRILNP
jgi:hypothetical protein